MTGQRVKQIRKNLITVAERIFQKHPVLFAYVYGGYATEIVHPFSDLDVGVFVAEIPQNQYLQLELSLALEIDRETSAGVGSEVRVINRLPLVITGQIVTEGVLIFSADEIKRVDFETSVRSEYFDFLPVLRELRSTYMRNLLQSP